MPPRAKQIAKSGVSSVSNIRDLLGPPPILSGEDSGAYEAFQHQIRTAVGPKDALEEIWVRDVTDLAWEVLRLRRLKAKLFRTTAHKGLTELLRWHVTGHELTFLVESWVLRDGKGIAKVKALLKSAELDEEAIFTETIAADAETFERFDRLIAQAEIRRNAILREIDRRRDALAQRLREATGKLLSDADFKGIVSAEAADR
jgi:hypothetical protein